MKLKVLMLTLIASHAIYAGFSANVALKSDYVSRGTTQTNNDPAIQGGFDYNADNGLYAGIWASNVSWAGEKSSIENDLYAGYAKELNKSWGLDVGAVEYLYPNTPTNVDYTEIYAGLSYKIVELREFYAPNYNHTGASSLFSELNVTIPLPFKQAMLKDMALLGQVGRGSFNDIEKAGLDNYWYWSVGLQREFLKAYTLSVTYVGNSLAKVYSPSSKSVVVAGLSCKMDL
jgi:uncharacterized protein (TIGR02001 family)